MRLLRSLTQSPIETLAALVLVGAGVYVSVVGSSASSHKTGLLTAGGILTTFGGVLLAWVASKAVATEAAKEDFQAQLGHLSRNLGQAAGQISRAVEQSQSLDISSETALALISQANRMIYGQVSEISVIQGTSFDSAYLLDTATKLDGLARQLESDGQAQGALEEVRRQIKEVRTSLSSATPDRTYSTAEVDCPHCGLENEVRLGDFTGDTTSSTCGGCGKRFNAHRRGDGSAFSRPLGPKSPVHEKKDVASERWTLPCPSCSTPIMVKTGQGTKKMVCFDCRSPLEVNLTNRTVELGEGKFELLEGRIVGRKGARPLLRCPECERDLNAFMNIGDDYVGVCYPDMQILKVPRATFAHYVDEEAQARVADGTPERAVSAVPPRDA